VVGLRFALPPPFELFSAIAIPPALVAATVLAVPKPQPANAGAIAIFMAAMPGTLCPSVVATVPVVASAPTVDI
jgi:hypothetical protein